MKLTIDTDASVVHVHAADGSTRAIPMDSPEAFELVSDAWVRVGWDTKYVYSFSWMGRPVIQLPEDMLRMQEVLYAVKPDVIVETGVAHGGSLIFYASLMQAWGAGHVIGVDIEIRPHNRAAIEAHEMFERITLIEGDAIGNQTISDVKSRIPSDAKVLVILDSCHTRDHVRAELEAYGPLVSPGSYIVATDGIMGKLEPGAPRTADDWGWNNPETAAREFVAAHPDDWEIVEPAFPFNEGVVTKRVTYWPAAYLRRKERV